jgi:hypothetical protein
MHKLRIISDHFGNRFQLADVAWSGSAKAGREVRVLIHRTGGTESYALLACMDHLARVGTSLIEDVERDRIDRAAEAAIVFSFSGFTRQAARSARHLGIECHTPPVHTQDDARDEWKPPFIPVRPV